MSNTTNLSHLSTQELTVEIEAIEHAIEGAFFVCEVVALETALAELKNELRKRA